MRNLGSQALLLEQDYSNHVVPHLNGGEAYRLRVHGTTRQVVYTALSIDRGARGSPGGFIRTVAPLLLVDREAGWRSHSALRKSPPGSFKCT